MKEKSYLIVVASSCQMYSGTGTAIFDWVRFSKDDFQFSFLIDTEDSVNFDLTRKFCMDHNIKIFPSKGSRTPGCPDTGIKKIPTHLNSRHYDFIECISWANASTNLALLEAKPLDTKLVYTPHTQPLWTLLDYEKYLMVPEAFKKTVNASDYTFIDSPSERTLVEPIATHPENIHFVPLGIDTSKFYLKVKEFCPNQIFCVCDCLEARKRVDLLLSAFSLAYAKNNQLRLVLAGKHSDTLEIPDKLSNAVFRLGYVNQDDLIDLYCVSGLFVLLSDYEAFGLPIAEALCCGCPVLLSRLDVLVSLFAELPGITFTENTQIQEIAEHLLTLCSQNTDRALISAAAQKIFCFEKTYGLKKSLLLNR